MMYLWCGTITCMAHGTISSHGYGSMAHRKHGTNGHSETIASHQVSSGLVGMVVEWVSIFKKKNLWMLLRAGREREGRGRRGIFLSRK